MRKTLGISLLVLLLTGSAVAGEMPNLSPAPPPPQTNAVQEPTDDTTTDGEIQNDAPDSLTQTVLDLLASLF
jgi:hypothetical protein